MKISLSSLLEKLIWLSTVFLYASFLMFDFTYHGKYIYFGLTILIVLMSAIIYRGILRIRLQPFHIFTALFAIFVALSSLWAMRSTDPIQKAIVLLQVLIFSSMIYIHYDRTNNIVPLLLAVKWAGYIVTLYSIAFYGLDEMLASSQDLRLTNEFSNVNSIAMSAALSCVLQWNDILRKRDIWSTVMTIPSVILITATQSRKALVLLLVGILAIYLLRSMQEKGSAKKVLKFIFYSVLIFFGLQLLLRLPIFNASMERMERMFNFFSGEGTVDHSTIERNEMIELGIRFWKENPIVGVGVSNPHLLSARYLNRDAYLHNNYVELLCGGGIIGFGLYYAMFVYLFWALFKYRKADQEAFIVGLVWLCLMLIMQYGMVSYYIKIQWYYLVVHFLNVSQMKRKYLEMMKNAEEPAPQGN